MDRKQFQEQIEQLAQVEPVKPKLVTNIKQSADDPPSEVKFGDEFITVSRFDNPTLGLKLKQLKTKPRICELGCGNLVKNQVIERRVYTEPELHWRTKCTNCKKTLGPTGELIHDNKQVYPIFLSYFRNKTK